MFFVSLTYIVPLQEVDRHKSAHNEYLDQLYREGKLHLSGRKVPRTGGFFLLASNDSEEVNGIIERDPFFVEGVARYETLQIAPTRGSAEFQHLVT